MNLKLIKKGSRPEKRRDEEPTRGVARNGSWPRSPMIRGFLQSPIKRRGSDSTRERRSISWNDNVEVHEVSKLPESRIHDFFYDRDDVEKFKEDALMEAIGFDPDW